jgi:hypothetical protein
VRVEIELDGETVTIDVDDQGRILYEIRIAHAVHPEAECKVCCMREDWRRSCIDIYGVDPAADGPRIEAQFNSRLRASQASGRDFESRGRMIAALTAIDKHDQIYIDEIVPRDARVRSRTTTDARRPPLPHNDQHG